MCMCMLMNISAQRLSDGKKPTSNAGLRKNARFTE